MTTLGSHPNHLHLLRKLATTTRLSPEDTAALLATPVTLRTVEPDKDVVAQGEHATNCTLILDGFACRYMLAADGRRQILSFHVPGDVPDIQSLRVESMDHGLCALRRMTVATIAHPAMEALMAAHPALEDGFWRETLVDAAIYRQWLFGLGRRPADVRLAHLVSETAKRFDLVGLTRQAAALPLKQIQLADALGLSPVHVNRVLQELRGRGLVGPGRAAIEVRDAGGLAEFGEFDAGYLRLRAA